LPRGKSVQNRLPPFSPGRWWFELEDRATSTSVLISLRHLTHPIDENSIV
jgi:hypothetical protein